MDSLIMMVGMSLAFWLMARASKAKEGKNDGT